MSVDTNGRGPTVDLLRFATAGSVDDGKSTLIGRLLYDTKSIFQDQLQALERASRQHGDDGINLALLTDGLRAEREQNITIDVAYRYFATPKRKFIIADTPGHVQYTRNMVTGASTADLAVILVDARKGVLTQSKRHGFIATLLGIPHLVLAVNKMDAVGFSQSVFDSIVAEYRAFVSRLDTKDLTCIPISALCGDNIVPRSTRTPWYEGTSLLHHLETVNAGASRNAHDFRFPVQYVIRPHQDFRGMAGRVVSGTIRPGDEIVVLPSGRTSRIRSVETFDGPREAATVQDSVVLTIEDELDVGRGDMVVRRMNLPTIATRVEAMLCWMSELPMVSGNRYLLMHTTRTVQAAVTRVVYRIDVDTLHRDDVATLGLNDIGRVEITTAQPIFFDPYRINRGTGSFILIDSFTNATVAAGMIRGPIQTADEVFGIGTHAAPRAVSPDVVWEPPAVSREEHEQRNGHRAAVLWLTGLSGSGKSTIARALERTLFEAGCRVIVIDGDRLRHGLSGDLEFSDDDRRENIRRAGEVARLFFEHGAICICTFISPFRRDRDNVRALFPGGAFLEVHVDCALAECERRDPKGLYARARQGAVTSFTGLTSVYEPPDHAEIHVRTDEESVTNIVAAILGELANRHIIRTA